MPYPTHLIPTTVGGNYPQPDWLIHRGALEKPGGPRVHARQIWRIAAVFRNEAQDDATILAIGAMERIGIDSVADTLTPWADDVEGMPSDLVQDIPRVPHQYRALAH